MWLYFQLIEAFQKLTLVLKLKMKIQKELEDKEISVSTKNELVREYKETYKKELSYLDTIEEKKSF